jgi:hypothetical protein
VVLDTTQHVLLLHQLEPVRLALLHRPRLGVLKILEMLGARSRAEGELAKGTAALDGGGIWF